MRLFSTVLIVSLLATTLFCTLKIHPVGADFTGPVYINADGSITPPTAPVFTVDNIIYSLTDNIIDGGIVVNRGGIVLDGRGHTVQVSGGYSGISIYSDNAMIENMTVTGATAEYECFGIKVRGNHDIICGNNVTNNFDGIGLLGNNNIVFGNNITANEDVGIAIGVWRPSSDNRVYGNNITNNGEGILISGSSNNIIYYNNFISNDWQVGPFGTLNVWDNGYPSGGNYWSDYAGADVYSGPHQDEAGSDGIGDTPYVIDASNRDNYPLMQPRFSRGHPAGTNLYLSMCAPAGMDRGNTMTYVLYYNDFGDGAPNVVLNATLPEDVVFVSYSSSDATSVTWDSAARNVTWTWAVVPAMWIGSVLVSVTIPSSVQIGTLITATAQISTDTTEITYDDNTASSQTTVTGLNLPLDVSVGPTLGNAGGIPIVYWEIPITFTYHGATATGVDITIQLDDGGSDITGSMTGGPPDWTFTVTFYPRHGHATVTYTVYGPAPQSISFEIYVDPAGYVYDVDTLERIEGASVWLQWPDGLGGWENVPTGQTPSIMQPDVNPLITGADGQYQWDVLSGAYRVHVEAAGYYPADSIVVNVPPPVTDLHVGLTHILTGDFNLDGQVSLLDLGYLAIAYNSHPGDTNWNPQCDLARPFNAIGLTDVVTFAMHYGEHT